MMSTWDDNEPLAGLRPASGNEDVDLENLRRRLVQGAESAGLLDIAYREVDSPVGSLLLAATPVGLVRVAFECEGIEAVLQRLADTVSLRILRAPSRLDDPARQLDEYFAGTRRRFELALDLGRSSGFRRAVLESLRNIDYGKTASYRDTAIAVHNPRAVRAVGTACATNPLPLVIPCHRVVRSDGLIGSYLGGSEMKRQLLQLEGAV